MLVIPGIDLKDGKCVRLRQGRMDDVTVFSDDPVEVARHWVAVGARRLHVVDLDGAVEGKPRNGNLIRRIVNAAGSVPVEVGGGIRDHATIEAYLAAGVAQAIIGTQAIRNPAFFEEACTRYTGRIMLGLDARDGMVATEGWQNTSRVSAAELACRAARFAPFAVVYTDIARDGTLTGVNVAATIELAEAIKLPVIASGGVTNLGDLEALARSARTRNVRLVGAIVGRALYEHTLDFETAQSWLDQHGARD
jgi:phosphoribosylformimino-5-aminoimidazole carboxamide ribotide isomerase